MSHYLREILVKFAKLLFYVLFRCVRCGIYAEMIVIKAPSLFPSNGLWRQYTQVHMQ